MVLGLTLLLSIPAIVTFVRNQIGVDSILYRVLIALVVSWVGLAVVKFVYRSYVPEEPEDEESEPWDDGSESTDSLLGTPLDMEETDPSEQPTINVNPDQPEEP